MGVQDFWKHVKHTGRPTSLTNLALDEGFNVNRHGTGMLIVGIDTSIWFGQCQTKFHHPGLHAQAGENPELRTLFYRLATLLKQPIIPIFVFDGPNRPSNKRGKAVRYQAIWYTDRFERFIRAFRFHCHTAPGEAEAELAALNKKGFIDAILTEDSDAFLFGARFVIHMLDNHAATTSRQDRDIVKVYATTIPPAGILLAAILNGGDYDQTGLRGCGSAVAFALAKSELAISLYDAATNMSVKQLQDFLEAWRADLSRELSMDPHGYLGRRYQALAASIPHDFPDPTTVHLYANPITSWSRGRADPQIPAWPLQLSDLAVLAGLCDCFFSWGSKIPAKFSANIWAGYCTRQLIWLQRLPPHPDHPFRLENIIRISKSKIQTTPELSAAYKLYRLETNLVSSLNTAVAGLGPEHPPPRGILTGWANSMWIPASIVDQCIGQLVPENMRQLNVTEDSTQRIILLDPSPVPVCGANISLGTFDLTLDGDNEGANMAGINGSVIDLTEEKEKEWAADEIEVIDLTDD